MNVLTPGIIIALLIMFLLGILAGYSLVQGRIRKQAEELKIAQRRLAEMEQSHELRLREATTRLRQDYETELAATIEHYQDQLSQKTVEMEQIYQTRLRVLQQGAASVPPRSITSAETTVDTVPAHPSQSEPSLQLAETAIANESMAAFPQPDPTRFERELEQAYEARLQAATQDLQQSHAQQLAEALQAARTDVAAEYQEQLTAKQQEFERVAAERQAELEQELADLRAELATAQAPPLDDPETSTPSQIMGIGNDDTTVTLSAPQPPRAMGLSSDEPLSKTQLEERTSAAQPTAGTFEDQLATQLAAQQNQFERQLAEQLETQQIEFDRRFRELETDYKRQLAEQAAAAPESVLSPVDELFSNQDFEELISNRPEIPIEDDLFSDEMFADTRSDADIRTNKVSPEPPRYPTAMEDDLFADDLFDNYSKADAARDPDAVPDQDDDDDDEDDFGPFDLSDLT
ncbi:MAG: hypothetical protein ACFB0E_10655 [Leptolyngbyaceae cyanobacterium]